jgi:AcrR family transcriptional regulator/DNA-binding MarR family transcriptional regulator
MAVAVMSTRNDRSGARQRPGSVGSRSGSGGSERPSRVPRVKPGVGEAGQGRVSAIQRTRMLGAMVEVAGERGAPRASVAHIVERAGISRRTFYEHFEDREDCFLAAFDHALARAQEAVLPAYAAGGAWRERVRAGLGALLAFFDEQPGLGALLVIDALGAGPRALERRTELLDALITVVDGGREEVRAGQDPPPLAADGVVGAVFNVLHARMLERRVGSGPAASSPLLSLVNPFMSMIVMPYLGTAAARRELERPVPAPRVVKEPSGDPLRDLDMRLTYRTVRVLVAIAEQPGASNRRVAEAAGVSDQGQISKLLARLEHLGLVANGGEGPAKGEPNAWTLTAKGMDVARSIASEASASEASSAR